VSGTRPSIDLAEIDALWRVREAKQRSALPLIELLRDDRRKLSMETRRALAEAFAAPKRGRGRAGRPRSLPPPRSAYAVILLLHLEAYLSSSAKGAAFAVHRFATDRGVSVTTLRKWLTKVPGSEALRAKLRAGISRGKKPRAIESP
jgi:hypothetical protein